MENEMFLSDLESILQSNISREDILKQVSRLLSRQFEVEICFCRIYGNRWSHLVATENFISPTHRFFLSTGYGIMVQGSIENTILWNKGISSISL